MNVDHAARLWARWQADELAVAAEKADHFRLPRDHLRGLGEGYGDFPAHAGLRELAALDPGKSPCPGKSARA